ncbi:MAG: hypothetical protein V3V19_08100 [Cocleimonas sp.]
MNTLSKNQTWVVAGLLLLILIVTRAHFFNHIQDASWAIFFMLGFYVRNVLGFPIFWLVAFAVDLIVIESKDGESYCFTVSYPFLIPAYASLWAAGRWFSGHYSENLKGLLYFVVAAVVGVTVCEIVSSGGFYWFSGRFENTNVTEFAGRITAFLPMFMKTTLMYLGIAAAVHLIVIQAGKLGGKESHT